MIEELQTFRWPHFKGEATWVCCFAHILNLIAQVVLRPFGSHKRNKTVVSDNEESDKEETEDRDDQIQLATHDSADDGDDDEDDAGSIIDDSALAAKLIDDDEVELEDDDVNELSDEDKDDRYTSNSCRKTLAKVSLLFVIMFASRQDEDLYLRYVATVSSNC
ncbi:hypothetical protein PGTUg99_020584 [Puccinia graminis f. sp. tritici]|uniref:Uncharacterized protein n=1 Tax=Puccinia graminis f. sp. tritici TaxID=56615 RepID=A0A5B0N482_PUCGR|nr:hypothetical protein PGTUg99_020584 [Puccinia graminis f. sp. tritici]